MDVSSSVGSCLKGHPNVSTVSQKVQLGEQVLRPKVLSGLKSPRRYLDLGGRGQVPGVIESNSETARKQSVRVDI